MTTRPPEDWNDLASLWQADAAGVTLEEVDAHLRREKRQMARVLAAELSGLAAGLGAAIFVMLSAHVWLGVVIIVFGGASAWLALRMRRGHEPPGSCDLLQSLKASIEREDWIAEQLRFGRVLSFVALFAIVQAVSARLFRLEAFTASVLIPAGISCLVVVVALAANLWLSVRSRRRRARLLYLDDRMKT